MRISRVLNTNAVLSTDTDGNETVFLGCGIGFKTRPGDEVDESKIEKRFTLKDEKQLSRFQELLDQIPSEYIFVAEQSISFAKHFYNMKLNESIHISLADHIHTSIENAKLGIQVPNSLLLDIKQYYPREYEVGQQTISFIEDKFHIRLPDDECGFVAMHFVNAQYGAENTNIKKIITFVRDVNNFILKELEVEPDEESLFYHRYMTHLNFFAQRVAGNVHYDDDNDVELTLLKKHYKKEYKVSCDVANYIKKNYNFKPNKDEIMYLTIHLAHLTQHNT